MGGKPSKGTPKDKRLKTNKPAAGKPQPFGGKNANPFAKKKS
jgi:hypothetical protein